MSDVSLKDLLEAGVHFGHQTRRWNPKMRKYIFAERGGIYLIDLQKTLDQLETAREMARETVRDGESVLFVCTKPQLAELVQSEAERCGAFYVTERWLGGMLTNFQTIKRNIRRLKELERGAEEGAFDFYTKKERLLLDRERQKLERYLSGIKEMNELPGMVFVVDAKKEEIAVKEANRLEIPVVAIADTNADPDMLDVPVPGNDDAIRSVSLITRAIADAVEAGKREAPEAGPAVEEGEAYTYSSDAEETPRRKRKRSRKRRRPRPEVIAAKRQSGGGEEEAGVTDVEAEAAAEVEGGAEEPADSGETAEAPVAEAASGTGDEDAAEAGAGETVGAATASGGSEAEEGEGTGKEDAGSS